MELLHRMLDGSMLFDLKEALASATGPAFRLAGDEKIRHLQRVPIFEECTRKQLRAVADISKVIEVPALAVLTRQGAREDEFFVIIDGTATVKLSARKRLRLGPGDFFGEMSLLDGEPRSATVRAETDLRLLVIGRSHFWELLREVPELTQRMLVTLSRRVRELEKGLNA
ncbi:MAG: cyclic nucleotide-binding domain-containing protein [Candidatus Rokubacteria bacterium]|nr:cyclic nucleotide-binding domain-containing protein [Candidatus Rokubacteria bacterium]